MGGNILLVNRRLKAERVHFPGICLYHKAPARQNSVCIKKNMDLSESQASLFGALLGMIE